MSDGVLDNFLSDEEKEYFKSNGKNEEVIQDKYGDNEPTSTDSMDLSAEEVDKVSSSESFADTDKYPDNEDATEAAEDELDESDTPTQSAPRDYEIAFKKELHKRKELKEQLEATTKRTAEMEAALNEIRQRMLAQPQVQKAEPQEVVPDPEVDPLGYQQYKIDKLESALRSHEKYLSSQHEQAQRQAQQQAFMETYKASAASFSSKQPDVMEAYKHLIDSRTKEHLAAGYTQSEADALIVEEEMAIASRAYRDRVNPAERLYNLAKSRGYGAAPAATTQSKNIDSLKKGLKNSKSLKSGGGVAPDKMPGLDDIDSMDFAEFDEFWAGYKNKSKRL